MRGFGSLGSRPVAPPRACLLCSAALLLATAPTGTQAREDDFPKADDQAALVGWLEARTNIAAATVVAATPELVVAMVGKTDPATPGGPVRVTLREEVIDAAYVNTVGGRSSLMSMEIQCEERRVRMDERRLHAAANLGGTAQITEPSSAWVKIPAGSIMDDVARAACDRDYVWPLQSAQVKPQVTAPVVLAAAPPPLETPPAQEIAAPAEPITRAAAQPEPLPAPEPPPVAEIVPEAVAPSPTPEAEPPPLQPQQQVASETPGVTEAAAPEPIAPAETETQPPQGTAIVAAEVPPEAAPPPAPAPVEAAPVVDEPEVEMAAAAPPAPEIPPAVPEPEPPAAAPPPVAGPVFAVQIGAYEDEESAQAAWKALSMSRPILVERLRFEIRPARVNGRDWLRGLVRDFATREDAKAFCTAIAGGEYGCILRTLSD